MAKQSSAKNAKKPATRQTTGPAKKSAAAGKSAKRRAAPAIPATLSDDLAAIRRRRFTS